MKMAPSTAYSAIVFQFELTGQHKANCLYKVCPRSKENLNQNKCSTLRVKHDRNGSVLSVWMGCFTSSRGNINKHCLYGSLKIILWAGVYVKRNTG